MKSKFIEIILSKQVLRCFPKKGGNLLKSYLISSAENGAGEVENSFCTPRGMHQVCEKIGDGEPINSVFVGRQPTGEIYRDELFTKHPKRDWILTRILRLKGLEDGFNKGTNKRGECCDSLERYIYIHGTPDFIELGKTGSHGCIRMGNNDLLELFTMVDEKTYVCIIE